MLEGVKAFRDLVYSKFSKEAEMARKLNWHRQRLNKITTGIKEPSVRELNAMANVMEMDACSLLPFFLPDKSPNGQQARR